MTQADTPGPAGCVHGETKLRANWRMGVRVGTLEEEQASRKRLTDSQVTGRQREGPEELQARPFVGLCGSRSRH